MYKNISYRVLNIGLRLGLGALFSTGVALAQYQVPTNPTEADMACSGIVTDQAIPGDSYVISGEDSRYKTTFFSSDYIYINHGRAEGVKAGDKFEIVRVVNEMVAADPWFKYQPMLSRAMGTRYADIGRLVVAHVDEHTSTAQIEITCGDSIQRGDLVRPYVPRPAPQYHAMKLDPFAAPSGKKMAMVVSGKEYAVLNGAGGIMYINLGSAQGVRVGDYFRVFRYQGTHIDTLYQVRDMAYKAYGFGSTPVAYEWDNLPRQVLGEGIVLRLGPNSSTVMLTAVREEIFAGDYVEVE